MRASFILILLAIFVFGNCKERSDKPQSMQDSVYPTSDSCLFKNGIHQAIVSYYNSSTNYNATYDLDVTVHFCQVVAIDFTNDGELNCDRITGGVLDKYGNTTVFGDDDKTFTLHITR